MNAITQTKPDAGEAAERAFDLVAFDRITENLGYGTDYKRAKKMRMSTSVLSRIRSGKAEPGKKFIAHMREHLGISYDQVFPRQRAGL